MVYNADTYVQHALNDTRNDVGMCLQQVRTWAGIAAKYGTAAEAWAHTDHRINTTNPPRGSTVWWTGGSHGAGHIATSLGNGKIRSTDAGGSGVVATVDLHWPETHWGLRWAGVSWDINDVLIPHEDGQPTGVWDDPINKWYPGDQDATDTMNAGGQLNQTRGYAYDLDMQYKKIRKALEILTDTL